MKKKLGHALVFLVVATLPLGAYAGVYDEWLVQDDYAVFSEEIPQELVVTADNPVVLDCAAEAAFLMEPKTGTVIYEKNADEPRPPASVTKIMSMLLVMEALDAGRISLTDRVCVSETAAGKGGSQIYLAAGEEMEVEELLKSVAVASANDACCALAEHIAGSEEAFVQLMNRRAAELGMVNTHFINCTGLDAEGHVTTARDISLMAAQLLTAHPQISEYSTIWMDTVRNGAFGLTNTNRLVRFYKGCTGLKTGSTSQAKFCLAASAERDGVSFIAVVMGCETSELRFSSAARLLDFGFGNFALFGDGGRQPVSVPVVMGRQEQVSAVFEDVTLLLPKGKENAVEVSVELERELIAPVERGQTVGTVTYTLEGQVLETARIKAFDGVPRMGVMDVARKIFRCFFGVKN